MIIIILIILYVLLGWLSLIGNLIMWGRTLLMKSLGILCSSLINIGSLWWRTLDVLESGGVWLSLLLPYMKTTPTKIVMKTMKTTTQMTRRVVLAWMTLAMVSLFSPALSLSCWIWMMISPARAHLPLPRLLLSLAPTSQDHRPASLGLAPRTEINRGKIEKILYFIERSSDLAEHIHTPWLSWRRRG